MSDAGPSGSDRELAFEAARNPSSRAGQRAAARLLESYVEPLYAWCFRLTGRREDALDLAQETMVAACRSLHTFQGRASFKSWLFTIARYRLAHAARRKRLAVESWEDFDRVVSDGPETEAVALAGLEEDRVIAFLGEVLDQDERTVFWLRCFEDVPVDEINRMMNLPGRSGARGVLQTARRKLKAALAQRRSGEGAP